MPKPAASAQGRAPDEKITVNLGVVDLGRIDLLVQEGFYSSRTDLIRAAVRSELDRHADVVRELVERRTLVLGIRRFTASELEAVRDAGERLDVRVLGLAVFADDITPELALDTIGSLTLLGALQARPALRRALATRTGTGTA